jgi:hypothetical protein
MILDTQFEDGGKFDKLTDEGKCFQIVTLKHVIVLMQAILALLWHAEAICRAL